MKHLKLTNKITALFLTMVMLLSMTVEVAAEELYTLSDVTNALKYIAGWGDEYYNDSYDYNGDGRVTIYDVTGILKSIADWDDDNICLKKPSDELIKQIEADYTEYMINNYKFKPESGPIYVKYYYGAYNGAVPVLFDGPFSYLDVMTYEEIAGSVFYYPYTNFIKVWKDGEFFSVKEAYELNYLTSRDIADIACYYASNVIEYDTPEEYLPK